MYLHYAQVYMLIQGLKHSNELQIGATKQLRQWLHAFIGKYYGVAANVSGYEDVPAALEWKFWHQSGEFYWAIGLPPHHIVSYSQKSLNLEPKRVEDAILGLYLKGKPKK